MNEEDESVGSTDEPTKVLDGEDQADDDSKNDSDVDDDEEVAHSSSENAIDRSNDDENESGTEGDDIDDDEITVKSHATEEDVASLETEEQQPVKRGRKRRSPFANVSRKGRTPSVKGLTIPFRTVKKAMKLDPDTPIVQNEAAIMTTFAVELFLQKLAKDSFQNARNRGRNTVRYEDVAEARTGSTNLIFLETLLP